jgi:anti-sigma-K factor RskA
VNRDHAVIEELLAVRSLGGLDGDDVELLELELASHGECAECRSLADGFGETAGRLAFALDPEPVATEQADEILHRATHPATQEAPPPPAPPTRIDELGARRTRRGGGWTALAAAAAVVVVIAVAIAVIRPSRSTDVRASTSQTVARFNGTGGTLAMAYEPGRPGAVLLGSGFSDPGADEVYEIWMLQGTAAVSAGCVRPHDGSIVALVDADLSTTDQMAVTVEADSCPAQPTATPILLSDPLVT